MNVAEIKIAIPESADGAEKRNNSMLNRRKNSKNSFLKNILLRPDWNLKGNQQKLRKNECDQDDQAFFFFEEKGYKAQSESHERNFFQKV